MPIEKEIKWRKCKWIGHVLRNPHTTRLSYNKKIVDIYGCDFTRNLLIWNIGKSIQLYIYKYD